RGTPPSLFKEIQADAFAPRNPMALKIDFLHRPPYVEVSPTHKPKTRLLDPRPPKVELPEAIRLLQPTWGDDGAADARVAGGGAGAGRGSRSRGGCRREGGEGRNAVCGGLGARRCPGKASRGKEPQRAFRPRPQEVR